MTGASEVEVGRTIGPGPKIVPNGASEVEVGRTIGPGPDTILVKLLMVGVSGPMGIAVGLAVSEIDKGAALTEDVKLDARIVRAVQA